MVSILKYTQTKHGNYSPNTHVIFHDIYSKPTQKKDDPHAYCFHTNYCVLYNRDRVTVRNMFCISVAYIYIYTHIQRYVRIYTHICIYYVKHSYIGTYLHTYIDTYVSTYKIHIYIYIYIYMYIGITYMYIYKCVRTYIHLYRILLPVLRAIDFLQLFIQPTTIPISGLYDQFNRS